LSSNPQSAIRNPQWVLPSLTDFRTPAIIQ
jgi:hypothetical protein